MEISFSCIISLGSRVGMRNWERISPLAPIKSDFSTLHLFLETEGGDVKQALFGNGLWNESGLRLASIRSSLSLLSLLSVLGDMSRKSCIVWSSSIVLEIMGLVLKQKIWEVWSSLFRPVVLIINKASVSTFERVIWPVLCRVNSASVSSTGRCKISD